MEEVVTLTVSGGSGKLGGRRNTSILGGSGKPKLC